MAKADFLSIEAKSQKKQAKKVKKVKERLVKNTLQSADKPKPKAKKDEDPRGVIYLGHLPHGFYEKQIKNYFKQFGKITGLHVSRSEKSGKSKGFAFVQFQNQDVAKVAAETMNNYLMMKKLLKAHVVAPDKVPHGLFKKREQWSEHNYPGVKRVKQLRVQHNKTKKDSECRKWLRSKLNDVKKMLNRLHDAGMKQDLEILNSPPGFPQNMLDISKNNKTLLEIDPSDEEVQFNIPPGVIVKTLKKNPKSSPKMTDKKKTKDGVKQITVVKKNKAQSPKTMTKLKMGLEQALKDKSVTVQNKSKIVKKKKISH